MLTLVMGVTGGLFLDDENDKAQQAEAVAHLQAYADAEHTEQGLLAEQKSRWAKENAIEQARLAAEAERQRAAEEAARKKRTTPPKFGPIPESCQTFSGNRAIGCTLMLQAGFGLDQMPCLDKLWTKESGWNHLAYNKSSGAQGIPQARPGSKMAKFGDDWETNPATQIKWGLDYIKSRYDTPCGAWQNFLNSGWY
ncbi:lytic transglycosylase domain-containing protein [Allorhizocola rhizosphaerae]|uniref:aggregation-promoting factor C-terminal-like domain-containing protein n=1 Tax=Allorhizocola rhizosphaerae TaxID=1872709 RepID=UPI0013C366A2|nr:lytic transglycosylase domain-containing protein [Allorhizocola rhizosphaerae]